MIILFDPEYDQRVLHFDFGGDPKIEIKQNKRDVAWDCTLFL